MTRASLAATTLSVLLLAACTGGGEPAPDSDRPPADPAEVAETDTSIGDAETSTVGPVADDAAATRVPDPPPSTATAVQAWQADVEPLSGPLLVDGVLVLYTRGGATEVYPSGPWLLPEGTSLEGSGPRWPLPPGVGVEVDGARVVTVDGHLVRWDAP